MYKAKIKLAINQIKKNLKLYGTLPHIWVMLVILVTAIIVCYFSYITTKTEPFLSSILANIFAGLVTGVVVSLIAAIKTMSIYRTENIIVWLENLNKSYLEFNKKQRKLLTYKVGDFQDTDELYEYIYDTLCCGQEINSTISQGQFKSELPFNPYKYCIKALGYDAVEHTKVNNALRDKISGLNMSGLSENEVRTLFKDMDDALFSLNGDVLSKTTELKTKRKALNASIM